MAAAHGIGLERHRTHLNPAAFLPTRTENLQASFNNSHDRVDSINIVDLLHHDGTLP